MFSVHYKRVCLCLTHYIVAAIAAVINLCILYYLAHSNRRNFILHQEEICGEDLTDTKKLSSSKYKSIKQWSKYATKNAKSGGDEVIMTRTIRKVGNKIAKTIATSESNQNNLPNTDNDQSTNNIRPIIPSIIPQFDLPSMPPIPQQVLVQQPRSVQVPPQVQAQPLKDQATKPQVASPSVNVPPVNPMSPNQVHHQYVHTMVPSHPQYVQHHIPPNQSVPIHSVQSVQHQPPQHVQTMVQQPQQHIHHQSVPALHPQHVSQSQPPAHQQQIVIQQPYQPPLVQSSVAATYRCHPCQK